MDHPSNHSGRPKIGILIIDDDLFVRTTLARELSTAADITILGVYESGSDAIADIPTTQANLALVDIIMPGLDGIETTRQLRAISPATRILALTSVSDPRQAAAMLQAGAVGFVPKDLPAQAILDTIRAACRGVAVLGGAATALIDVNSDMSLAAALTPAELRIAGLVAEGKTNKEIAATTFASPSTVKNHLTSIMRKLGVRSRVALAIKAHKAGL